MKAQNNIKPNLSTDIDKIQRYKSFTSLLIMVIVYEIGMFYYGFCLAYLGAFKFSTIVKIFRI